MYRSNKTVLVHNLLHWMFSGRRGRDRISWIYTYTHMQSVSITTKVVSSNPAHGEMYSIQHYVSLSVTCGMSVVFSGFLHQ